MEIKVPYYQDSSRISNSAIGWFLKKGPRFYKDMIDGKEEGLKLPQLERGTMIHEYILQPDEFWNDYTILDFETPKVKQQKDFCDAYANSIELLEDEKLLTAYRSAYNNQKTSEIALKEATELSNKYADYIKPGVESHNEFHINWELKVNDWIAPCKSLLDRCIFDHVNKKITLIDLKTTSDVYNFKHSVEEFDYYRQLCYYLLAISWYMNDLGIDISDYDCEAYIIAIQTNGSYEVRVFDMFNQTELESRKDLIISTLAELSYHYQTGNWDHTRKYYENYGVEQLQ